MAERMGLQRPAPLVITVAGTNGKGSCVASLEALLQQAGYRSASYTSPHIHTFNERIRVDATDTLDATICAAFAWIEQNREATSLSYFEYATLAAFWIFEQARVDVAILEVGLGGRLDAVNLIDADVAIISSISLDHQDWLGNDLESIGAEKAGILRSGRPALYASLSPPASIVARARELQTPLQLLGSDFGYMEDPISNTWDWFGSNAEGQSVNWTGLSRPVLALSNVSAAIQALHLLPLQLPAAALQSKVGSLSLAGRCELRKDHESGRDVLFDVAHNPAGAVMLAANLRRLRARQSASGHIIAVLAVMADKDVEGIVTALESCVDIWYIAQVEESRCLSVDTAVQRIKNIGLNVEIMSFISVQNAYVSACEQAAPADLVLVTGSFRTVAAVRALSDAV